MQGHKNQHDLTFVAEELHRLFDSIPEVPYSAPPLERPEIICFARRIEVLTGYTADEIVADGCWAKAIFRHYTEQGYVASGRISVVLRFSVQCEQPKRSAA